MPIAGAGCETESAAALAGRDLVFRGPSRPYGEQEGSGEISRVFSTVQGSSFELGVSH